MKQLARSARGSKTTSGESPDQDLIIRFLDGDGRAFEDIFNRYHRSVYKLTYGMMNNVQSAEDLTQETFLHVLRSLPRMTPDLNFSAWIHRIATNLCLDELRKNKKALPTYSENAVQEDAALEVPDVHASVDPQRALEQKETRRMVWEVAQALPVNYRIILTLRELHGLNYQQIAQAMGLSVSAVETLLFRARRRFREIYGRRISEGDGF
jgi:RNA polymerase sigma-70 factor (ECF subfamily)